VPKTYTNLRSIPLSQIQKDFLIGAILGDSCLYKESKTPRLTIAHSIKQLSYFNYKLNLLFHYIVQQDILKEKFNLDSKIKFSKYYYLTFNKENTIKVSKLCEPYIINEMKYKFLL